MSMADTTSSDSTARTHIRFHARRPLIGKDRVITMKASGEILTGHLKAVGLLPLNRYGAGRLVAALMAVSAPIIFALLAEGSRRWDLFERSGSITAAIGLFVASRRYVRHGALELAMPL